MAYIEDREQKNGTWSYVVRWRASGARTGKRESETFDDLAAAERFRDLVSGFGEQWPPGWIRGRGFAKDVYGDDVMFEAFAMKQIDLRGGAQGDTRGKYKRLVQQNMTPWFGNFTVRDGEGGISREMVQQWVDDLRSGAAAPLDPSERKPRTKYAIKTVLNQHGLLHSILQAAVDAEQSLRASNPCDFTSLPRADGDQVDEEMCFLEPEEFHWIYSCLEDDAKDLAEGLGETGARWGELTALQPRDLIRRNDRPAVRIARAWKQDEQGTWYVGAPKTKKSRRVVVISERYWQKLKKRAKGLRPDSFFFRAPGGGRWHSGTFRRDRWLPAIAKAAARFGLSKVPRLHDVRHSHASWLIARRVPLPAIQGRLGHESITTTVDRYGHLLDALDDEILAAVEWAMDPKAPLPAFLQETGLSGLGSYFEDDGWENDSSGAPSDTENEGVVYAVSVAGREVLFAHFSHAQLVVDQWTDDRVAEIAQQRQQGGGDGHGRARVALGPEERLASADATKVWTRLPARQYVYSAMASYHPDGSLAYEPPPVSGRWVWEFEVGLFTVQPAQHRRELRPHGGVEVQARGTFRAAVERCFEQLCVEGASAV